MRILMLIRTTGGMFLGGLLLLIVGDKSTEGSERNVTPTAPYASNSGEWWSDEMAFPEIHSP